MYLRFVVLLLLLILNVVNSRGSRGGGSRGGGSRSGSSRSSRSGSSGSRSGAYVKLGSSSRYSSWARTNKMSVSFRYRTSSYTYKRTGITTGLIIMSPHQHRTFVYYHESSYNDINICYNEFPLYDRNITQSPWFVCPWFDTTARYCCGDEIEERCCRYFDRPGHLTGLIVALLILLVIIAVTCHCCCKRRKREKKADIALIYVEGDKLNTDDAPLGPNVHYPSYPPMSNPDNQDCPPYPQPGEGFPPLPNTGAEYPQYPVSNEPGYPLQPINNAPGYPMQPTNTTPGIGYAGQACNAPGDGYSQPIIPNEYGQGYPQYSANPSASMPQPQYPTSQPPYTSSGYDDSGPNYPLIPPENPPPAYSDVVKQY